MISIRAFRWISTLEAISFLLLLGIAMPLKYFWDMPQAVSVVGMVHGLLFIAYLYGTFQMRSLLKWSNTVVLVVLVCSVLPFGPFYTEKKYLPKNKTNL